MACEVKLVRSGSKLKVVLKIIFDVIGSTKSVVIDIMARLSVSSVVILSLTVC